ncbi:unnamed protein product [Cyprideis torosa]|uniref:Uncharacterized protein n=1 Tax=Cyprideis torosa TaxID=163714 RepID=A0A7R8WGD9_9CRUS|nr:unnamed protein product [Cyprideis torosa]CAG0898068.1 unnamed protein product [Cyprideis torosa]
MRAANTSTQTAPPKFSFIPCSYTDHCLHTTHNMLLSRASVLSKLDCPGNYKRVTYHGYVGVELQESITCYSLDDDYKTWQDAAHWCSQRYSGYLVDLYGSEEWEAFKAYLIDSRETIDLWDAKLDCPGNYKRVTYHGYVGVELQESITCYSLDDDYKTWQDAAHWCSQRYSGYLVDLYGSEEWEAFKAYLIDSRETIDLWDEYVWIGATTNNGFPWISNKSGDISDFLLFFGPEAPQEENYYAVGVHAHLHERVNNKAVTEQGSFDSKDCENKLQLQERRCRQQIQDEIVRADAERQKIYSQELSLKDSEIQQFINRLSILEIELQRERGKAAAALKKCEKSSDTAELPSILTCPEGFLLLGRSCYALGHKWLSWHASQTHCRSLAPNGRLAEIDTREKSELITRYYTENRPLGCWYWIGAEENGNTNQYSWSSTKTPVKFYNWGENQPTSSNAEDKISIDCSHGWKWYDQPQSYLSYQLCEAPPL